jgi:hypothetical protein
MHLKVGEGIRPYDEKYEMQTNKLELRKEREKVIG